MPTKLIQQGEGLGDGEWLPLTEYSIRSGLSLSTIRRKIKGEELPTRFENGRYLVLLEEMSDPPPSQAPQPKRNQSMQNVQGPSNSMPWFEKTLQVIQDTFELALREKEERLKLLEKQRQDLEVQVQELRLLTRVLEEKLNAY